VFAERVRCSLLGEAGEIKITWSEESKVVDIPLIAAR